MVKPSGLSRSIRVVPPGTVAWGMQLPIQSQSTLYVSEWEKHASVDEMAAIAVAADAAGCFYLGVCDHTAIPARLVDAMGSVWYDTIATLGWLAGFTKRTRLLSHVVTLSQRHPLRAAKEFSTLDRLSHGRLVIGVGVGHVAEEFDVLNGPGSFAQRGKRGDEAIEALMQCLEAEAATHKGSCWSFSGMHIGPRAVQEPRPPVWIGGSSPAALRRVAAYGDGWLPQGTPRSALHEQIQRIRELRREFRNDSWLDIGTIVEPMHIIESSRNDPGWELPAGSLIGHAEQIAESLRGLVSMGVNHLQVRFRSRSTQECIEQIQCFAASVAPLLTV